jgi:hypothetical protein
MWIKGRGRKTASLNQFPKTWKKKKSFTVLFLGAAKRYALDEKWERNIMGALSMKVIHARSVADHEKSGVLLYRVA